MITEDIRLARIEPAPNLCSTLSFNTTEQGIQPNWMSAQIRALCSVRTAPVSHHPAFHSPFALRNIGPIPISTQTSPSHPPEFPLQQQVTGSNNLSSDATMAPERVYNQPTIPTRGFEPWSLGAPLHRFLHDALTKPPNRPLITIEKENVLYFSGWTTDMKSD
jgi:hypothetical protein